MTSVRINSIFIPPGSCDADCAPVRSNIWRTDFPITDPARIGIGYAVEPAPFVFSPTAFALHDHNYTSANVPNAGRAVVTYEFSAATNVLDMLLVQHTNGITEIEGFMGDAAPGGPWTSMGIAKSRLVGSATGPAMFVEGAKDVFQFPTPGPAKKVFKIIITRTSLANGYAAYRLYPRNKERDPFTVASNDILVTMTGRVTFASGEEAVA